MKTMIVLLQGWIQNYYFCYDRFYTKILGKIDNKKIVITSPFDSLPLAMKLTGKIQKLSTNKECITYSEFISKGKKRAKR